MHLTSNFSDNLIFQEVKLEAAEQESQNVEKETVGEEATGDRKFTGRCRLFVGNLSADTTEKEFKEMFDPYGESSEMFLNAARAFGFIRMVSFQCLLL